MGKDKQQSIKQVYDSARCLESLDRINNQDFLKDRMQMTAYNC